MCVEVMIFLSPDETTLLVGYDIRFVTALTQHQSKA